MSLALRIFAFDFGLKKEGFFAEIERKYAKR